MLIIEFYDEVYLFGSINSQLSNIVDDHNLVMIYVVDCHTRISGHQDPGANIITRCAGTKSHTYDESWHRIECHNFTIGVLYKINNYIIRRQRSSNPKLTGRRRPRPLTNTSQHPPCASSCGTCSWPVGGCETARVSSHTFIAQQVVGNNVHELAKGGSSREV